MFTHHFVRHSLPLAFALTLAGSAFARQPKPLVDAQAHAQEVLSTCADSALPAGHGYRDMLARANASRSAGDIAVPAAEAARMRDHVVLACEGGRVHAPGGYRDLDMRFRVEGAKAVIAGRPANVAKR